MTITYEMAVGAFLAKITEYNLLDMAPEDREDMVIQFLKAAATQFRKNCKYDLVGTADDAAGEFGVDIDAEDADEILDILSEGMVVQWLKPYVYRQENLENALSTRDFTVFSPAELTYRISGLYSKAQRDFTNMIREYSYNHGDLTVLHL